MLAPSYFLLSIRVAMKCLNSVFQQLYYVFEGVDSFFLPRKGGLGSLMLVCAFDVASEFLVLEFVKYVFGGTKILLPLYELNWSL